MEKLVTDVACLATPLSALIAWILCRVFVTQIEEEDD